MSKFKVTIKPNRFSDDSNDFDKEDIKKKVIHNITSIVVKEPIVVAAASAEGANEENVFIDPLKELSADRVTGHYKTEDLSIVSNQEEDSGVSTSEGLLMNCDTGDHSDFVKEEGVQRFTINGAGNGSSRANLIANSVYAVGSDKGLKNTPKNTHSFSFKFQPKSTVINKIPRYSHAANKSERNVDNIKEKAASVGKKEEKCGDVAKTFSKKPVDKLGEARKFNPVSKFSEEKVFAQKKRKKKSSMHANKDSGSNLTSIGVNMMLGSSEFVVQEEKQRFPRRRTYRSRTFAEQKKLEKFNKKNADYPKSISVFMPCSIQELAKKLKRKVGEIKTFLIKEGESNVTLSTIFSDSDTVQLIGVYFNCEILTLKENSKEDHFKISNLDNNVSRISRPPVVVLMGHVDHGKTSIIDFLKTQETKEHKSIVSKEAGSITQNIGAFQIKSNISNVTIIDTPGHAAFSMIREKGAYIADFALIIISGTEGIREQTIESINAARACAVSMIVVITKSDLPEFNVEKVYSDMMKHELVPEAWGGDIVTVPCSTKTGEGMEELLNAISLQAEISGLTASLEPFATGVVILSIKDNKKGSSASILIKDGKLSKGQIVVSPSGYGKVKILRNYRGEEVDVLLPSEPGEIFGFSGLPVSGELFKVVKTMKDAKAIYDTCNITKELVDITPRKSANATDILNMLETKTPENFVDDVNMNIFVKAPTTGMLTAVIFMLTNMSFNNTKVNLIGSGIGSLTSADAESLLSTNAIACCLQVGFLNNSIKNSLLNSGIRIIHEDVIYRISEKIIDIAKSLAKHKYITEKRAELEILAVFKSSKLGKIAGCVVNKGVLERNHLISVFKKDEEAISLKKIVSMKTGEKSIKEAGVSIECGIILEGFDNFEVGDKIHSFAEIKVMEEI